MLLDQNWFNTIVKHDVNLFILDKTNQKLFGKC
jgi:hypothetical protein